MRKRLPALFAVVLCVSGLVAAADAVPADKANGNPLPTNFFAAARARKPVPGEWIEYRVGFPVDPLENSLRPDPAVLPGVGTSGSAVEMLDGYEIYKPAFEPEVSWRVLPLRLEIRQVTPDGCNAILTFEGSSHQFFLPMESDEAEGELYYDAPKEGDDRSIFVKMGGEEYEVEVIRRSGDGYGFVRYFSPEVPFGVFRFATGDVDLVMVGCGRGRPPAFPLAGDIPIDPPLGRLFK